MGAGKISVADQNRRLPGIAALVDPPTGSGHDTVKPPVMWQGDKFDREWATLCGRVRAIPCSCGGTVGIPPTAESPHKQRINIRHHLSTGRHGWLYKVKKTKNATGEGNEGAHITNEVYDSYDTK